MNKRLIGFGLTSAITLSGCAGEKLELPKPSNPEVTVTVIADHDVQLYMVAFVQGDSLGTKAGTLKAGAKAVANCFQGTKTPEISSVHIRNEDVEGFAGVNSFQGSKDETPTQVFNISGEQLQKQLPAC